MTDREFRMQKGNMDNMKMNFVIVKWSSKKHLYTDHPVIPEHAKL